MKTKFFTLLVLTAFVFATQHANAKILRVGYWGTAIAGTDYPDLQTAYGAAGIGDTLLIFPGSYTANFTDPTLSKKLVVMGYGYFVTGTGANDSLQVTQGALSININLNAHSDSTTMEGLDGLQVIPGPNTNLEGVLISYCNIRFGYSDNGILTDWKITRSVLSFFGIINNSVLETFQNLLLENDIITSISLTQTTFSGCIGVFNNNIFTSTPNFNNGGYSLFNNIFLSTTAPANIANCVFSFNIASNKTLPSGNNNNDSVNINTVFVGYPALGTFSNDDRYRLAPGSPAIGAGENGVDCGIYGGTNPYRLSGIPSIPSFYKLTAPSGNIVTDTKPYVIFFSVKSNN